MAAEDLTTASRCETHPHRGAVALCDVCGRGLCLSCAVPVRGRVLGAECLTEVLGADAPVEDARSRRMPPAVYLVGLGFVITVVAGAMPWTRFGVGSGRFGGWGYSPLRWSLVAAAAGAVGMAWWMAMRIADRLEGSLGNAALGLIASAVAAGGILHIVRPPPFTHAWLGPWFALGGAAIALAGVVWSLAPQRGPGTEGV